MKVFKLLIFCCFFICLCYSTRYGDSSRSIKNMIRNERPSEDKYFRVTFSFVSLVDSKTVYPVSYAKLSTTVECRHCIIEKNFENLDESGSMLIHVKNNQAEVNRQRRNKGIKISKRSSNNVGQISIKFDIYTDGDYVYLNDGKYVEKDKYGYVKTDGKIRSNMYQRLVCEIDLSKDSDELNINYIFHDDKKGSHNCMPIPNGENKLNYLFSYTVLTNVAKYVLNNFGINMGKIKVFVDRKYKSAYYSTDSSNKWSPGGKSTFIPGYIYLGHSSEIVPAIMLHEYGHYFMEFIYWKNPFLVKQPILPGGDHRPCSSRSQSADLSWSEGFATGFGQIVGENMNLLAVGSGDWEYWYEEEGPLREQIEYYFCDRTLNVLNDEGWVTAMLYDLYDINDDFIGSVGLEQFKKKYYPNSKDIFFGVVGESNNIGDFNSDNRINMNILLVNAVMGSDDTTIQAYINYLCKHLSGSHKDHLISTAKYNYGSILVKNCANI